jgi:hypothetical protein
MIPKLVLLLVLLMSAFGMNANPIDMRTAQEVAVKFMNANAKTSLRGTDDLQLVTTYNTSRGDAAFYVFNTSNGFVIVSADDCATPILGYSDEGPFDVEDIPIQLQDYLQDFVSQIQYGIENHLEADEATAHQWEMVRSMGYLIDQRGTTAVAPLLTDTWGQGCYYNNMCPVDSNGSCGHTVTGCAATSFAQIMHYWEYPTNGMGSHTYTPDGYPEQTANFGATTYDWAHMPNSLSSSSTTTEINAVATLMWHCGVAINMGYGAGASSASPNAIPSAMVNYFGYSNEMSIVYRSNYSDDDWLALMKNYIDLGCPIHYSGWDIHGLGGHGFVCDGYDASNLLHFNWGWSGYCNGYFSINAMNPSSYAFTVNNMAIINIHPSCTSGTTYQISATTNPSIGGTVSGTGTYSCGDVCTLTATANQGYGFKYWTEDDEQVSTEASFSFIAMDDRTLVAHFAPPFSIATSVSPIEGGTVIGGGTYYYNQHVTLTAVPSEGYAFDKWTKDGEVFSYFSTLDLTVTEDAEYIAYFEPMDGIAIGEATSTNMYLPTYYYSSLTQQIYTVEEMGSEACEISSVSFFNTGTSKNRNLTIYMVNTNKTAFNDASDWIPVTEANQVFSGSVTMAAKKWTTIYFATPFSYDGSSNVALIVDDNSNNYNYGSINCRTFDTDEYQAIRICGSGTDFDPYNPSTYTGTLMNVKNQVVLGIPSYDYTVTATVNPANSGTVNGGGPCYFNQPITLTATPNEGFVFYNWTKDGNVLSYLSRLNLTVTESAEYVANFQEVTDGIVIGDATNTNTSLPTYSYYSLSEQIYTANEMGGVACQISSVSFFHVGTSNKTRNMNIYMVNTNKTSFESTSDWISVSENDIVYSGNVTFSARDWVTVYFSTPFVYDGVSNVALIVDDNSNGYNTSTTCRVFSTVENQAIYIYGNSNMDYDPTDPSGYTGTLISMKNQVVFGFPSYDYTVTVTANPSNGGTVSGGGLCYLNQPITLTATSNEGYIFSNWTKDGSVVSYTSTYSLTVTESAEYVAHFELKPDGIVIGDGTYTGTYLPAYYYNSLTQQIYTANEMGGASTEISSVSFFNTYDYSTTRNWNVYMVNTDKFSFESISDWIPVSENDLVFSGNITMTAHGWATVYFSTPFLYDGTSNVALIVDDNTNSNTNLNCRTFGTEDNQAIRIYGYYNSNYDPYSTTGYTGVLMTKKNQVIFGIPSYDFTVTATVGSEGGGTVSGGGLCYLNQPITLTAMANEGYIFSHWTKNGTIVSYTSKYDLTVTESAEYVAHFELKPDGIVIGDETYANSYLPTYYYSSLTQQIYTASEMGGASTEISSVSFFNTGNSSMTRNWNVYLVNTEKSSFTNTSDWIPVSENDLVFSGNVVMNPRGWTTIILSTPFLYDGLSNVALIVDDNSNSYNSSIKCRTFRTEESQAIRIYGYNTDYDPINPYDYTGTLMTEKNQIVFHQFKTVTATATPIGGGTVSGEGVYAYGLTCTLTATPNAGYYFLNWTEEGEVVSYDAAYSFTVNDDRNLVANFVEGESTCTIVFDLHDSYHNGWSGNYLVVHYSDGSSEQFTLESGSSVSYSREIATGSILALSWIEGTNANQCSFDIKFDNDVPVYHGSSLNANFQQELYVNCAVATAPHTITIVVDPEEGGTVEGAGTYDSGTVITLTATPNAGYSFIHWKENGTVVSSDTNYSFTVTSDRNLMAFFSLPLTVSVTTNMAAGGTVTGAGAFNYGNTCTLRATPNEGYLFLHWSKNGGVVSCNATYSFAVTEEIEIEAVFMRLEGTLIGQGESTNNYLPSFSNYNYTLSQQIYSPDEIGTSGSITSISYYNAGVTQTRNYDIYMVHTDKTTFENATDWITVSEADRVYRGSVNITKGYWTTIELDTPFAYDGSSNLAIIVDDNTGTWSSSMACRVFNANGYQAIRVYSDGTNYDPYNPTSYSGTSNSVKNQLILGITPLIVQQTVELAEGWNWFSTYIELEDPIELLEMLQQGLGDNGMQIESVVDGINMNAGDGVWVGDLMSIGIMNEHTYMIEVTGAVTFELQGPATHPEAHPITIYPGDWSWIGYPCAEEVDINVALSGLDAEEGDMIETLYGEEGGMVFYLGGTWVGDFGTMIPGRGYMYFSNSDQEKTLVFP